MMRVLYKASLLILAVSLLTACSRKKNTFLNRNMRALATEYNVLFNGESAFEDAKKQLASQFTDNFWEILPIERIDVKEEEEASANLKGKKNTGKFNRAEEKATKAIQKHSMYIQGREYNSQIDEAYLLLGKARYYDGRFIPAMDAFNFILERYPSSNSVNKARVWRAKTNIRLNNEESAIENIGKMLKRDELEPDEKVDANAMMAQAYINLDSLPQALEHIKIASELVKDNELKGRYSFIKGQLYNRLEEKDSANMAFDEIIALKRKTSRNYLIAAHMEKIRNFDYENGNHELLTEKLTHLAEDRENRPFLDRIYYETGVYYQNIDSTEKAVSYYNKSIKAFKQDRILQSRNYRTLAEINFDHAEYRKAGAYYDSTLTFLKEKSRDWRLVKKKRENLDDVIRYEDIATTNDSILKLVKMDDSERLAFFTTYTNKLKEKAIQDSIAQVKAEQMVQDNEFYRKKGSSEKEEGGSFYFYNQTTVAHGKQTFRTIWGDRRLEDNWRLSTKTTIGGFDDQDIVENQTEAVPIAENELFKPETYIARIPSEPAVIDSITTDRNFAYYQLGLIYKEKFKEPELASERLEKLLTFKPEERLIVASEYHLVKIYQELGRDQRMNYFRDDILTNFADTRYAEILRNPDTLLEADESSPEFKYNELYKQFENHQYADVISKVEEYIVIFEGTELVPKFELLKATAIGRQNGFDEYKKALNFVSLNYPNSKEGIQAQEIYDKVLPGLESAEFSEGKDKQWKLAYQFSKQDHEKAVSLKTALEEAIKKMNYSNMKVSIDYYNPSSELVVVHGLNSKFGARGFGQTLKDSKDFKVKTSFFEISSPNYKTVQMHKNLEDYFEWNSETNNP